MVMKIKGKTRKNNWNGNKMCTYLMTRFSDSMYRSFTTPTLDLWTGRPKTNSFVELSLFWNYPLNSLVLCTVSRVSTIDDLDPKLGF